MPAATVYELFQGGYKATDCPVEVHNILPLTPALWHNAYVEVEKMLKGRKVYLDYTGNPKGFDFSLLSDEAKEYLLSNNANGKTPIEWSK